MAATAVLSVRAGRIGHNSSKQRGDVGAAGGASTADWAAPPAPEHTSSGGLAPRTPTLLGCCRPETPPPHAPAPAPAGPEQQRDEDGAPCTSSVPLKDPPCLVRPGLLIGSRETEEAGVEALRAVGVTHILQCGLELAPSHPGAFSYGQLRVTDTEEQDIVGALREAFDFIDAAHAQGGCVLVHCAQGVSRSGAVLAAYLMARGDGGEHQQAQQGRCRCSYEDALAALVAARPQVAPNPGFALQLRRFADQACDLGAWQGWSASQAAACFAASSVSQRREVNSLRDMIKLFHCADVGEEDTVFSVRDVLFR